MAGPGRGPGRRCGTPGRRATAAAALAAIPDEVVDELIVHGSPEACREHLERYVDNGVDTPAIALLPFPGALPEREALRALAPQ